MKRRVGLMVSAAMVCCVAGSAGPAEVGEGAAYRDVGPELDEREAPGWRGSLGDQSQGHPRL